MSRDFSAYGRAHAHAITNNIIIISVLSQQSLKLGCRFIFYNNTHFSCCNFFKYEIHKYFRDTNDRHNLLKHIKLAYIYLKGKIK